MRQLVLEFVFKNLERKISLQFSDGGPSVIEAARLNDIARKTKYQLLRVFDQIELGGGGD